MSFIILLIIALIALYFLKQWIKGGVCTNRHDMTNQFIIITGASSGLGKETAKDLIMQGAKVVYACRSQKKAKQAIDELPDNYRTNAVYMHLDLCDYSSIQTFADTIKTSYPLIDILINNAGAQPVEFAVTKDNCECFIQGNHLGPMLLTLLLLDHFAENKARIINISSRAHWRANLSIEKMKHFNTPEQVKAYYFCSAFRLLELYSVCKIMNIYFTQYLAELLPVEHSNIKSVCLHPGLVNTPFFNYFQTNNILSAMTRLISPIFAFLSKNTIEGIQTHLHLCYCSFEELVSGAYYADCSLASISNKAKDKELRKAVIDWSLKKIKERIPSLKVNL